MTFMVLTKRYEFGPKVLSKIKNLLFSPRFWVFSAILCFAGYLLLGYHQDQMTAKMALDVMAGRIPNAAEIAMGYEAQRQGLLLVSFTMLLVAILFKYCQLSHSAQCSATSPQDAAPADIAQSDAFQPIRTQEEIIGEDAAETHQTRGGRVSRVASQLAQSTFQVARLVKSRQ